MDIFYHLIPEKYIIGIGPLMLENTTDQEVLAYRGSKRYRFDLHLVAHTTTIKSDWFHTKEEPQAKDQMKIWHDRYHNIRERLSALLDEPSLEHEHRLEQVNKVAGEAVDLFESVCKDLVPADDQPAIVQSINLRKQRILNDILDLKALALN